MDFARERAEAREHAERHLLDGDDPPTMSELAEDRMSPRPQRTTLPFHEIVKTRQKGGPSC